MKIVHIQSVLPQEDVIALKEKAHESSIKEAISKAVYHYLKCNAWYGKGYRDIGPIPHSPLLYLHDLVI
jgi:hypothetical protein